MEFVDGSKTRRRDKGEDATSTPPPLPSFVTITTIAISRIRNRSSPPPWLLRSVFTGVATTTVTLVSSLFLSERIVAKMIEMIDSGFDYWNVICARYDKYDQSCPVMELLTSSSWEFLLSWVGHTLMVYLLQHTLMFLPFLGKKHINCGPSLWIVLKGKRTEA
ncbi:hypothetical protein Bca52824_011431 [Brassica carinata]|uniref:Uncharacterized protein n=1 Tax=Brassica carinata TaxID=52824 RepID=A0A8X8BBT7_BRACI|nr:hypothetical protein Bca52824_011431 [Brassica carinata]